MSVQLTLDGREVSHPPARQYPLSPSQRELMRFIRGRDTVRTSEVGTLVHAAREDGPSCPPPPTGRIGCCRWSGPDGLLALHRLEARGLVERVGWGRWRAVPDSPETWTNPQTPPEEDIDEMERLYARGLSYAEVAAEPTVLWSAGAVRRALQRRGVPARQHANVKLKLAASDALDVVALYGQGYSLAMVAELTGLSYGQVQERVRRFARGGARSRSEAQRIAWARGRRSAASRPPSGGSPA